MSDVVANNQPEFFTPFWRDVKGSVSGMFVFSGSKDDYVETSGMTFIEWMTRVLKLSDIPDVVIFSPGERDKIIFPDPSTKLKFVTLLGLDKAQAQPTLPPPGSNPFADLSRATPQRPTDPMDIDMPTDYASCIGLIVDFLKKDGATRRLTETEIATAERIAIEVDDRTVVPGLKLANERVIEFDPALDLEREYTPEQLGETRRPIAAAFIDNADKVVPSEGAQMAALPEAQRSLLAMLAGCGTNGDLIEAGNPLVLCTRSFAKLHDDIRSADGVTHIRLSKPKPPQREAYIRALSKDGQRLAEGLTVEKLTALTAGLDLRHIQDLFLRALAQGLRLDEDMANERKMEIVQQVYGGRISMRRPTYGFDSVGGHATAKRWHVDWLVKPIKEGYTDIYTGVAYLGPPGTLKTVMAEATAFEIGWNFIEWNAASVRGMYQGQTEANTEETFEAIEASMPCVVLVDEADKAFATPGQAVGGAGSAENSLLAMTQSFMSKASHRGQILWIFTSNYGELIPPALVRPGRIDQKIPLLTPDDGVERAEVFMAQLKLHGRSELVNKELFARLVEIGNMMSDEWTQAEQDKVVIKSLGLMRIHSLDFATALSQALATLRPETGDVAGMTANALAQCADQDLVPPKRRPQFADRTKLAAQATEYRTRERKVRDI